MGELQVCMASLDKVGPAAKAESHANGANNKPFKFSCQGS
jgi:hypothetical protein